jgi:hypothetical protein
VGADRALGCTQYQWARTAVESLVFASGKEARQKDGIGSIGAKVVERGIPNVEIAK